MQFYQNASRLFKISQLTQRRGNVVGNDNAVVDCAQPAGHDNSDGAGMVQPGDLVRQMSADVQAFKLRTETGAGEMERVSLERLWRCRFGVNSPLMNVGDVLFQSV